MSLTAVRINSWYLTRQAGTRLLKRFIALIAAVTFAPMNVAAQTPPGSVTPHVRISRQPGEHLTGRLLTIDANALTIMPDGQGAPVRIPLSSISTAEVSEGKRSRVIADLAGIGVGVGVSVLIGTIVLSGNEKVGPLESPIARGLPAVVFGGLGGAASGFAIAHLIGRERWRQVPITSLVSLVTPAATRP
jgi:hypothetical protein